MCHCWKSKPHFVKFFLPGITDNSLSIPKAFFKNFENQSSGTVSLVGPSGSIWQVDLVQNLNGLFFQNGWKTFVRDHSVQVGYFLVFRYDGNLRFTVQIFDTSGCENSDSFYAKSGQENSNFKEYEETGKLKEKVTEAFNASLYKDGRGTLRGRIKKLNETAVQHSKHETLNGSCRRTLDRKKDSKLAVLRLKHKEVMDSSSKSTKSLSNFLAPYDKQLAQQCLCEKATGSPKRTLTRPSHEVCMSSTRRPQPPVWQSLFNKPANSTKKITENPSCILCPNCLTVDNKEATQQSYYLHERHISCKRSMSQLCRQTRSAYSVRNNQLAVRQPLFKMPANSTKSSRENISSPVRSCCVTKFGKEIVQQSLWKRPISSCKTTVSGPSRLARSDCLTKATQLAVRKPLFKKSSSCTKSLKKSSHQVLSNILTRYKKYAVKRAILENPINANKRSKSGPSQLQACQSLHKESIILSQNSEKPSFQVQSNCSTRNITPLKHPARGNFRLRYGSFTSQRRSVSKEEIARALDKAKSFKPENPHCVLVMRAAYVYKGFCLALPTSFSVLHLPRAGRDMTIWDPNGKQWIVKYVRNGRRGSLSGGWSAVAIANNLEEDDVCVFELLKSWELRVHIFRVVEEITPLIKNANRTS